MDRYNFKKAHNDDHKPLNPLAELCGMRGQQAIWEQQCQQSSHGPFMFPYVVQHRAMGAAHSYLAWIPVAWQNSVLCAHRWGVCIGSHVMPIFGEICLSKIGGVFAVALDGVVEKICIM